jgi:hypothetical protein
MPAGTRSIRAARSLHSGALHRHSAGALTSRAAFPVMASAFAIAWEQHCRFCLRLSHKSELSARRKSPSYTNAF